MCQHSCWVVESVGQRRVTRARVTRARITRARVARAKGHKGWGSPRLAVTGIRGHKKCPTGTRRSAPREALDPCQGEAMLGQALREKPALRFSECSGQD